MSRLVDRGAESRETRRGLRSVFLAEFVKLGSSRTVSNLSIVSSDILGRSVFNSEGRRNRPHSLSVWERMIAPPEVAAPVLAATLRGWDARACWTLPVGSGLSGVVRVGAASGFVAIVLEPLNW